MPVNYFVGQTEEWLREQIAACQEDMALGKTLIQWGAGDSSGIRKVQLTPQQRFEQLYFALSLIAPTDFPPGEGARVRRTTPRYIYGS